MVARLYKEHGLQTTVDLGMTILQGRALGGTTFVNNAICFRLGDPALRAPRGAGVLEDWRALGAAIDEPALHRAYDAIEHELGVARVPDPLVGASGHALLDGWRALDPAAPAAGVFRKNLHACIGCGYCNYACPYGHKVSALETLRAAGRAARRARGHRLPRGEDRAARRSRDRGARAAARRSPADRRGGHGRRRRGRDRLQRAPAQERHPPQRRDAVLLQRGDAGARCLRRAAARLGSGSDDRVRRRRDVPARELVRPAAVGRRRDARLVRRPHAADARLRPPRARGRRGRHRARRAREAVRPVPRPARPGRLDDERARPGDDEARHRARHAHLPRRGRARGVRRELHGLPLRRARRRRARSRSRSTPRSGTRAISCSTPRIRRAATR